MVNVTIGFSELLLIFSAFIFHQSLTFSIVSFCLAFVGVILRSALEYEKFSKEKNLITETSPYPPAVRDESVH